MDPPLRSWVLCIYILSKVATREGPPESIRAVATGTIKAQPFALVGWAKGTGGASATQADIDAWLTAYRAAWITNLLSGVHNEVVVGNFTATLFQSPGVVLHSVKTGSDIGTAGGSGMIEDCAACKVISWNTSVYWRGGKPRTYLPSVLSNETTDGATLTTTAANSLATKAAAFRTAVNALTSGAITATAHGFVSFVSGGVDRVPPIFYPSTGASVHRRIGTQRGRLGPWVP